MAANSAAATSGISLKFGADLSSFRSGVGEFKSTLSDLSGVASSAGSGISGFFGNVLGGALNLAGQGIGVLKDQLVSSVQVAMEHQQIMAQTTQAIKSTGDASGVTASQIENLGFSMSKTTMFSNDQVQAGENLLLTFTGIGKDVFPQTTQTMLDMAQAMHIGPTQAAMQLGKALDDPAKGLTALSREGVTFSTAERQQIQTMLAHNDVIGAQKIMLQELQKEFGGSAAAAGQTLGGQLQILKNDFQDVKEKIGGAFLPVLQQFTGFISSVAMPAMDSFGNWFSNDAAPAINGFGDDIKNVFTYVGNVLRTVNITPLKDAFKAFGGEASSVAGEIGRFVSSLAPMKTDFDPIADAIGGLAKGALNIFAGLLNNASAALTSLNSSTLQGKGPLVAISDAFKQTGAVLAQFGPPLKILGSALKGEFGKELKDVSTDVQQFGKWFSSSVLPAINQAMPGFINLGKTILGTVLPAFVQIRGVVVDVIQHAFQVFAPIVEKIVPPLIKFAGVLANDVANGLKFIMPYVLQAAKAIGDFAEGIMDRVAPIITNVINGITPVLQNLFKFWNAIWPGMSIVLQGVFKEIVGVIQIAWAIVTGIFNIALDLISGNWSGAWKDMQKMLGGIWDGIKTMVSGAVQTLEGELTMIGGIVNTYLVKPFESALGSIGGVFSAIGKLIADATTFNWGAIPGDLSSLGVPGFASGVENFRGGWAMVGEKGPELLKLPSGSSVFDNSKTSKMFNASSALDNFKASSLLSSLKSSASVPSPSFNYPAMAAAGGHGNQDIHVHINVSPEISIDKQKLTKAIGDDIGKHIVKQIRVGGNVKK